VILDLLVFLLCAGGPWLFPGPWPMAAAGAGIVTWFVLVQPTWRKLLPFFLTVGLVLNLVATIVVYSLR